MMSMIINPVWYLGMTHSVSTLIICCFSQTLNPWVLPVKGSSQYCFVYTASALQSGQIERAGGFQY